MKLSENGLYVERYIKCGTCGVLIYENRDQKILTHHGVHYCSQWCLEWKEAREARRATIDESGKNTAQVRTFWTKQLT